MTGPMSFFTEWGVIMTGIVLLIVFVILCIKKKEYLWSFLFCLGLAPLLGTLLSIIGAYGNYVVETGNFLSIIAMFALLCMMSFPFYLPSLILAIVAAVKIFKKPNKIQKQ